MSKLRGLAFAMAILMVGSAFGQGTWVKPRINKNGKYVKGYHRRTPTPKPKAPKQSGLFKAPKPKVSKPKKGGLFGSIPPAPKKSSKSGLFAPPKPPKSSSSKSGLFAPPKKTKSSSKSGLFAPPKKTRSDSGLTVRFPRDNRFMTGDRIVSVKDSSGKTFSLNTPAKYRDFMSSHVGGSYTVKIRRDGKYLTRKVNSLSGLGL